MTDEERLRSDARGVSEVVGSILVFGLLISLIAILQTQAVPVANEDVEFNHNEEVQGDLIQYQEAASRTAAQGTTETVGITMGTTYPSRLVFFNPRDPSGTIRTVGNETARVQNVNATSPIIRENYIDNETDALETKRLEYTPNYNEFENPPRNVLEYGIQYEDFGETTIVNNRGNVVNGNNIDLTFFAGELSRTTSSALSLDASPASAPARTVTVTPDNENDPVEITLPSGLDNETWEEDVLAPELEPDGNVLGVVDGASPGTVTIRLNGSVNRYTLRMPVIGVGSGVEQPAARYVFSPEGRRGTAPIDSPREVTFEIRDKYNNPVRGEAVFFAEGAGFDGTLVANRLRTDAEGRVSVLYEAPDEAGIDDTVQVSFEAPPSAGSFDPSDPENLEFTVTTVNRQIPTGDGVETTVDVAEGDCFDLDTLSNKQEFEIDWTADIDGNSNFLDTVRIEVIDEDNGELADSTEYRFGTTRSASENTTLRDRRETADSCNGAYRAIITATSDGGRQDRSSDNVTVSNP